MTDYTNRAREAWAWARTHPMLTFGAGVAVLLMVLWAFGALEGAVSGVRDWWADREVAEQQEEIDRLKLENATLEGKLEQQGAELVGVREQLAAKDVEIERLAREAGEQDAKITEGKKRVGAVRSGRDTRPINGRSELDRRLGELYPDAQ
jgi:hypothetical protein